jgi:hypothetical protein
MGIEIEEFLKWKWLKEEGRGGLLGQDKGARTLEERRKAG